MDCNPESTISFPVAAMFLVKRRLWERDWGEIRPLFPRLYLNKPWVRILSGSQSF